MLKQQIQLQQPDEKKIQEIIKRNATAWKVVRRKEYKVNKTIHEQQLNKQQQKLEKMMDSKEKATNVICSGSGMYVSVLSTQLLVCCMYKALLNCLQIADVFVYDRFAARQQYIHPSLSLFFTLLAPYKVCK